MGRKEPLDSTLRLLSTLDQDGKKIHFTFPDGKLVIGLLMALKTWLDRTNSTMY